MELGLVKDENRQKTRDDLGLLLPYEEMWVRYFHFLDQRGYRLRPRYHPDWVPSWRVSPTTKGSYFNEDSIHAYPHVVDAVRKQDGEKVMLKHVQLSSQELEISLYVSSLPRTGDLRNHCVQILDVILIPACETHAIVVMPLLYAHAWLEFRHVGEFVEVAEQLVDCLDFLHDHCIVHRDFCRFNVLIDPTKILPKGFHPFEPHSPPQGRWSKSRRLYWRERWSTRPNRYYLIDFGFSMMFESKEGNRVTGRCGQDASAPEMSLDAPYDPFPVDVYQLGNMLLILSDGYRPDKHISKLRELALKMTLPDAGLRLTAKEAASEVHSWAKGVGYFPRRRRIWPDDPDYGFLRSPFGNVGSVYHSKEPFRQAMAPRDSGRQEELDSILRTINTIEDALQGSRHVHGQSLTRLYASLREAREVHRYLTETNEDNEEKKEIMRGANGVVPAIRALATAPAGWLDLAKFKKELKRAHKNIDALKDLASEHPELQKAIDDLAMAEAALRSSISDFYQKRRSSNHDSQWQSTIQAQAPAQAPPSSTTVLSTNQQPQQRHLGISPQDPVIQAPMRLPPSGSHLSTSRSHSAHQPQPLAGVPEETISQQMRGLSVRDNSVRPMRSISGSSTAVPLGGQPALPSQVYHAPPMMQHGPPPFVPQPSNQGQRYHTAPSGHATYQPEQQYIPQSLPPPPVRNPPESRQWPTPQQTRPQEPGSGHHRGLSDLSAFKAPVPGSSRSSQYSNTGSYNSGNDQYGGHRPSTSASGSSWDEYNRAAAYAAQYSGVPPGHRPDSGSSSSSHRRSSASNQSSRSGSRRDTQ
ncbi:hypothetical protein NMY22_g11642 [Coprinellus aureogranulatus]|nr:hypothetical protein NMY22_g11642 [Coprinellus aureogranulatus]